MSLSRDHAHTPTAVTSGQSSTPPPFPVPDFDDPTVVFGASEKDFLAREQLGDWLGMYGLNSKTPYHEAVEKLFYAGGKLSDFGLTFKSSVDAEKAGRALRALMGSWAPQHEVKIGTCAWALHEWCDLDAKATGADQ